MAVRLAVLKGKDPQKLLEEIENIDKQGIAYQIPNNIKGILTVVYGQLVIVIYLFLVISTSRKKELN